MSTTVPTPADPPVSPRQAFDRLVWNNPRVCNGCFEHVRDFHVTQRKFGGDAIHTVRVKSRTNQATLEPDEDIVGGEYDELRSETARTTCSTCARVGCWADDDSLSKIQMLRLTTPLLRRLAEEGESADQMAMLRTIRHLKSQQKYEGRDTEIFRAATTIAVRRG